VETVGAQRRFFACAHKGGDKRPEVVTQGRCMALVGKRPPIIERAQSGCARHHHQSLPLGARQWSALDVELDDDDDPKGSNELEDEGQSCDADDGAWACVLVP
jgi:hypothetical protein